MAPPPMAESFSAFGAPAPAFFGATSSASMNFRESPMTTAVDGLECASVMDSDSGK